MPTIAILLNLNLFSSEEIIMNAISRVMVHKLLVIFLVSVSEISINGS